MPRKRRAHLTKVLAIAGKWLAKRGNEFASAFAKTAGAQAAKWLPPIVILVAVQDRLLELVASVVKWLQAMLPP